MSRREDIDTSIWQDPDFDRLSNEAQLVYLWAFTNPRCGMAGIYRLPKRQLLEGRPVTDLDAVLDELSAVGFLYYSDGVLWVRSRVKYLRTRTRQIKTAISADLDKIPADHPLSKAFVHRYHGTPWAEGPLTFDRPSEPLGGEPNPEPSGEPQERFQGKGRGKGKGSGKGQDLGTGTVVARAREAGFPEWLAEHEAVTGCTAPGESTKAYADLAGRFVSLIDEGRTLADLKVATRGALADRHRRENGYFAADNVLRPKRIDGLIDKGKRAERGELGRSVGGAASKVDADIARLDAEAERLRQEEAAAA